ncbi:ion channel [Aureibacter tunicatorum]|uniref:Inward rectifier potassium channel n=1 Tax=Aureibacter tunicatorum TaxID=866807 RepID=A0AAE4BS38_9BACT|nr:ion channel [Aureibacter tunicatorum]MDR6239351.1 inward rectifier potassium channel [Aureibacter tunicatorum]BDD04726.1 inward rectifier potassium channel Irk [Aureibacter tunicatorum]
MQIFLFDNCDFLNIVINNFNKYFFGEDVKDQDIGFSVSSRKEKSRLINDDGNFNVKRFEKSLKFQDVYYWLLSLRWSGFLLLAFGFIVLNNLVFAVIYFAIGAEFIDGADIGYNWEAFDDCLYFSFQTFTTVGYGAMSPIGVLPNVVASIEAVHGLITFSLVTALIYARFSKPTSKIRFSKDMLISPWKDGKDALMFRLVNERSDILIEMKVTVVMVISEKHEDSFVNKFHKLELEHDSILYFPLNWTVVHPIDENSPIYKLGMENKSKWEFVVQVQGFDNTFSQVIYQRKSYLGSQIVEKAKFNRMFHINDLGETELYIDRLDDYFKSTESE